MLTKLRLKRAFSRLKKNLIIVRDKKFDEGSVMEFLFTKKGSLIRPWQFEDEFMSLLKKYKSTNPKFVMEIGTANGGTLFAHCKLAQDNATIISVDLPGGTFGGGYPEWKENIYKLFSKSGQQLNLIRASSHSKDTIEKVSNILKENKLDYILIDGDHTYEGVKRDFEIYSPFVRKGGLIIFHDIAEHPSSSCKVDVFWNEIKEEFSETYEYIKQPVQGKFGIGVIVK